MQTSTIPGSMQSTEHFSRSPSKEDEAGATGARSFGRRNADAVITALGWFSIGLGVAQLLTPRTVSRMSGLGGGLGAHPNMIRACGARELASGVGILSGRQTSRWLWSRVAGDAIDLALIGTAARSGGVHRRRLAWVAAAVAGITALDAVVSMRRTRDARAGRIDGAAGDIQVERSLTINRSPDECYRFWRDFENFPRFMQHLESVVALSDTRSHWIATGPAGTRVEWDAEIVADEPGRLLAWSSSEGADIDHAGIVRFEEAPGGRGTIVHVEMRYSPPGGTAGALIAKLFGEEPEQQIADDLRHFKQLLETGEIPTTVGQPSGRRGIIGRLIHKGAQQ
jgi:uncharacterized membrane protein